VLHGVVLRGVVLRGVVWHGVVWCCGVVLWCSSLQCTKYGHSVAFLSKLNKHKVNFTYEKELFGLVEALRIWRYLLLEKYFKVFTDHRIIINLMEQKETS
jgi:RNase H-like domain found in reverse transcriptase